MVERMSELLQKLSSLSGREYSLLETLVRARFIEGDQLLRWVQQIVDDRLALAEAYLGHAQACDLQRDSECRQAISRAYYATHHAGRAVVYEVRRRDVATHEGVIAEVGHILGEEAAGVMHGLHRLRNQVDYELYLPRLDLRAEAEAALAQAGELLSRCRAVVRGRR
jgi:uncharacterized protein (UPF0332 family)